MDDRPIGLTGAIAGGKSTVLALLAEMGLKTASSDAVAKQVFREQGVQRVIAAQLGVEGPLEPQALREAMTTDPSLRRWINRLMHPIVGQRLAQIDADIVEVPLLFEACLQYRYRQIWCVACGPQERARRLLKRYGLEADIEAYGRWQLDESVKGALSDFIVRTDRPIESVHKVLAAEVARSFPGRFAYPG